MELSRNLWLSIDFLVCYIIVVFYNIIVLTLCLSVSQRLTDNVRMCAALLSLTDPVKLTLWIPVSGPSD